MAARWRYRWPPRGCGCWLLHISSPMWTRCVWQYLAIALVHKQIELPDCSCGKLPARINSRLPLVLGVDCRSTLVVRMHISSAQQGMVPLAGQMACQLGAEDGIDPGEYSRTLVQYCSEKPSRSVPSLPAPWLQTKVHSSARSRPSVSLRYRAAVHLQARQCDGGAGSAAASGETPCGQPW